MVVSPVMNSPLGQSIAKCQLGLAPDTWMDKLNTVLMLWVGLGTKNTWNFGKSCKASWVAVDNNDHNVLPHWLWVRSSVCILLCLLHLILLCRESASSIFHGQGSCGLLLLLGDPLVLVLLSCPYLPAQCTLAIKVTTLPLGLLTVAVHLQYHLQRLRYILLAKKKKKVLFLVSVSNVVFFSQVWFDVKKQIYIMPSVLLLSTYFCLISVRVCFRFAPRSLKGNPIATTCNDILDKCVLPALWLQFDEHVSCSIMTMSPHTKP